MTIPWRITLNGWEPQVAAMKWKAGCLMGILGPVAVSFRMCVMKWINHSECDFICVKLGYYWVTFDAKKDDTIKEAIIFIDVNAHNMFTVRHKGWFVCLFHFNFFFNLHCALSFSGDQRRMEQIVGKELQRRLIKLEIQPVYAHDPHFDGVQVPFEEDENRYLRFATQNAFTTNVESLLIYSYRMEDRHENGTFTTGTMYEGHHELTERQRLIYLYHYDTMLTDLIFSNQGSLQIHDVDGTTLLGARSLADLRCLCRKNRQCQRRLRLSFFEGVFHAPHSTKPSKKTEYSNDEDDYDDTDSTD